MSSQWKKGGRREKFAVRGGGVLWPPRLTRGNSTIIVIIADARGVERSLQGGGEMWAQPKLEQN